MPKSRRRLQLTHDASRERNRIEKLLEHVNVKIGNVLSDVFAVSGQSMLLALLDGKASAEQIAQLALGQAKGKIAQLTEALEGHCMRDHERFLIRSSLRHLSCLQEETEEMDAEILRRMEAPPFQEAFLLLQTIPGIGQLAAASILAKTGTDLSPFPTAEKMASWAGSVQEIARAPEKEREARPPRATHTYAAPWSSLRGLPPGNVAPYSS